MKFHPNRSINKGFHILEARLGAPLLGFQLFYCKFRLKSGGSIRKWSKGPFEKNELAPLLHLGAESVVSSLFRNISKEMCFKRVGFVSLPMNKSKTKLYIKALLILF